MPNKQRERFYLQQLRSCSIGLPDGEAHESESPDFLIFANETFGVEFTEFHLPAGAGERPYQEVQSLQEQVVDIAENAYASSGGPALYVHVIFGRHGRLTKGTVRQIGETLADVLLSFPVPRSIKEGGVDISRTLLPAEIAQVRVHGSVDGVDRLWQCGYGSWVAPVTMSHIKNEIDRKQRTEPLARKKCDRLWLVLCRILLRRRTRVSSAMQGGSDHTGTHLTGCFGSSLTRPWPLILVALLSNNRFEKDLRPAGYAAGLALSV